MKLYFSPGACSLSPHIFAKEADLPITLVRVNTKTHQLEDGTDYYTINEKGAVPLLELDNGERLSEGVAIVQYMAEHAPNTTLIPPAGTFERARQQEWLNYITSELHKGFSPLFKPNTPDAYKPIAADNLKKQFAYVDRKLAGKNYLMGDTFTAADAYLFTVSNWSKFVGLDLSEYKNLTAYLARVAARPAVQEAMKAEGLIKA